MRLEHIIITVLLLAAFGAVGYLGLRIRPQSDIGPWGLGAVLIGSMALIIEVIPQPEVTTIVLLIYSPIALIVYLVFLWRWRATHKAKDLSHKDQM